MKTQKKLFTLFKQWLKKNEERFTDKEKKHVTKDFNDYLLKENDGTGIVISDELYDFLVTLGITSSRHEHFVNQIEARYPKDTYPRILEVGAGRLCKVAEKLVAKGYYVTAMDKNIRLSKPETKMKKIIIMSDFFSCDLYAKSGEGTKITDFDLIIGLEPCEATEHIIRQGIAYQIPFEVRLCATPHNALNNAEFSSRQEWYDYLHAISTHVGIYHDEQGNSNAYLQIKIEDERVT